ncbi:MAG: RNA polymerase sigma factor [Deltaproteobacteria bacterium]|jgi:RNA polymerase sigma-70 factor (ECF subfamily)
MSDPHRDAPIREAVEATVRADGGRLLALLIRHLGDFELAEDCLQDALASALVHWRRNGVPHAPEAWLMQVARRKAIDRLRRDTNLRGKKEEYAALLALEAEQPDPSEIPDERLRLIFTCCHPALDEPTRIALTLRTLGGLTTEEIARAFVVKEQTMGQRLVRARHKITKARIPYEVPDAERWHERLDAVLTVLYLIFNEGYASCHDDYIRTDLCEEAIRLTSILARLCPEEPEVEGLLALMLLPHARRRARLAPDRSMVPLEEQDRSAWDHEAIATGVALVETALKRGRPGPFSIQAAVSALHAEAPTAEATDWAQIVLLYETLKRYRSNPIYELNRVAALAHTRGADVALSLLEPLRASLGDYQPFHALEADLLRREGRTREALDAYDAAIAGARNDADRKFLERRRETVRRALDRST